MSKPTLSLEHFFLTRSYLSAIPSQDSDESPEPIIRFNCELLSPSDLACTASVQWGVDGQTLYCVAVDIRAVFSIDRASMPPPSGPIPALADAYIQLCLNAAQLAYGAARSHIATITALGPHPAKFLPTIHVNRPDIEVMLSDEMAELGWFPMHPEPSETPGDAGTVTKG